MSIESLSLFFFFFSSRRRHTRSTRDWSSDVCSSDLGVTRVVSIESRGFLLGAPVALALEAGLVPIRKPGKLPAARGRVEYALEYGTDALEMHRDAVGRGDRVLIVDDVLATGGTAEAAAKLVRAHGADVVGFTFLIELDFPT